MKITQIFFLVIVTYLTTCRPERSPEPTLPDYYFGTATALKNGQVWETNPFCKFPKYKYDRFFIEFNLLKSDFSRTEELSFEDVPIMPGTYHVIHKYGSGDSMVSADYSYWDYDQFNGGYNVSETGDPSTNFITIESFDTLTKEVKGRFSVIFGVYQYPINLSDPPDTIKITDGQFHGKVIRD
jgi:hypothetical protein